MQQVTINVPDNKLDFFKELIHNLGFTQKETTSQNVLTPRQIQLVEETRKQIKENPDTLLDWEDIQHQIDWDAC